jgi:hypothetical protein
MVAIYKDYKELHIKKDQFLSDITKPYEPELMTKIDETIFLGHNLRNSIDCLKSKLNFGLGSSAIQCSNE